MSAKDAEKYARALETWVAEHPFLGSASGTSSVVFDAMITTRALHTGVEAAVQRELQRGASANPFLAEFYVRDGGEAQSNLPPEHIGIVYASLRAQLSLGDTASLVIEGPEEESEVPDDEVLKAVVEIMLSRKGTERSRVLHFDTDQIGTLRLGAYVEDVEIAAPYTHIDIGPGSEAILIAPISIQCDRLTITTSKVIAEAPPELGGLYVYLESKRFEGSQITSVPTLRGDAQLAACWPGARSFPWTTFATEPTPIDDPRLDEALRRFRKFVISFRSHSKGNLGRYRPKIEHARMTKGTGQAVLDMLLREGIIGLQGTQYYLNADRLGEITGATYADAAARRFGPKTIAFVKRALNE